MFTKLINQLKEKFMELSKEELAKLSPLGRYRYHRESMEKYFVEENRAQERRKVFTSPSGKYQLTVDSYGTKPGCWNYSRGCPGRRSCSAGRCWMQQTRRGSGSRS